MRYSKITMSLMRVNCLVVVFEQVLPSSPSINASFVSECLTHSQEFRVLHATKEISDFIYTSHTPCDITVS